MEKPKKEYYHAVNLYDAMMNNAEENDNGFFVYTGKLTELSNEIGQSPLQYSRSLKILRALKCVDQQQRGSRYALSVWTLYFPPTIDAYNDFMKADIVAEQNSLMKRLEVIEGQVASLVKANGGLNVKNAVAGLTIEIEKIKEQIK